MDSCGCHGRGRDQPGRGLFLRCGGKMARGAHGNGIFAIALCPSAFTPLHERTAES